MKTFERKLDLLLWAFVWVLPFLAYVAAWFMVGEAPDFISFINLSWRFDFVADILDGIWSRCFNGSVLPLSGYISYIVSVEIVHVFLDVMIFIPRFAHDLCVKVWSYGKNEK